MSAFRVWLIPPLKLDSCRVKPSDVTQLFFPQILQAGNHPSTSKTDPTSLSFHAPAVASRKLPIHSTTRSWLPQLLLLEQAEAQHFFKAIMGNLQDCQLWLSKPRLGLLLSSVLALKMQQNVKSSGPDMLFEFKSFCSKLMRRALKACLD